jgi:hypothetical protein
MLYIYPASAVSDSQIILITFFLPELIISIKIYDDDKKVMLLNNK